MTAPSPGIIAAALLNEFYDTEDAYLGALGRALQVEYEAIVAAGFLLQIDAPDLALERHVSYQDRPLGDFIDFAERVVGTINDALVNVPRDRVRFTPAGEIMRDRMIATWTCMISCRRSVKRRLAGGCCRSPILGMRTNTGA